MINDKYFDIRVTLISKYTCTYSFAHIHLKSFTNIHTFFVK